MDPLLWSDEERERRDQFSMGSRKPIASIREKALYKEYESAREHQKVNYEQREQQPASQDLTGVGWLTVESQGC